MKIYEHQSTYNPNMPLRNMFYISRLLEKEVQNQTKVLMLNINPGKNREILEKCRLLHDYMEYVTRVRAYADKMEIEQAVERGIQALIMDNIEEGVSEQRIIEKLQKRFEMTEKRASQYYQKYKS